MEKLWAVNDLMLMPKIIGSVVFWDFSSASENPIILNNALTMDSV